MRRSGRYVSSVVRRPLLASLLFAIGCAEGVLGAPCDIDSDCEEGLACDLHDAGGSCQRAHAHDDAPVRDCSADDRDDTYAMGLTHSGAWATVAILDAIPAPPSRGDNTWTVQVIDADATPRDDLAIVVDPFMRDHGHGSTIRCDVEPGDAPGTYVLTPVNMFMPGLWDVTLHIAADDRDDDAVVFSFCVDP